MPALTKAARKAVGVPKAVSLDDGTKLKRKLEKSKLDRVLDKEIALPSVNCAPSGVALPAGPGLPAMPSCLPHQGILLPARQIVPFYERIFQGNGEFPTQIRADGEFLTH